MLNFPTATIYCDARGLPKTQSGRVAAFHIVVIVVVAKDFPICTLLPHNPFGVFLIFVFMVVVTIVVIVVVAAIHAS